MRGKENMCRMRSIFNRITPAYAGKSSIVSPSSAVDWDHPRLCGEKFRTGKLRHEQPRITPAYAGKSEIFELSHNLKKDHPRLCGEKHFLHTKMPASGGSPPPMRGKVTKAMLGDYDARITPAYAGKSRRHLKLLLEIEDHPRLCGEKIHPFFFKSRLAGSPPPMRGKD